VHGEVLYDLIPAHFNQLLVFDDRIVHATPTIEGTMDPMDGRIAMVGHIRATSPIVTGNLDETQARSVVREVLPHLRERIRSHWDVQGTSSRHVLGKRTAAAPLLCCRSVPVLAISLRSGSLSIMLWMYRLSSSSVNPGATIPACSSSAWVREQSKRTRANRVRRMFS
jgi:hypothetical protein